MMKQLASASTLCLAAALSPTAFAWNSFGHMTVAAAAYSQLTPAAHTEVTKLLKLNPMYSKWVSGVATAQKDETAFMLAATWPDVIKSASGYTDDGNTPSGPDSGQNIGYTDKLEHRYWHFIDEPFSPDDTPLVQPASPNALTQITMFRATLASTTASDNVRSYDLVWLMHLIGDVHQPLHSTSRFTSTQASGDEGGNLVDICNSKCNSELHAFWDDILGTSTNPQDALTAAKSLPPPDATLAAIDSESQWVQESFLDAQNSVYVSPIGVGAGPFTITTTYTTNARTVAKQRIALAGARLAQALNEALQ